MTELDAKIDRLYRELDDAVAEIEQKHPEAHDEIDQCKAKVAEFRHYRRPTSDGELITLSQAHTTYLMGIHFIRGSLDRNKTFDSIAKSRSEKLNDSK